MLALRLQVSDALIHLRVPAAAKARWVRESRAAGMRLTDWISARIEQEGEVMIAAKKYIFLVYTEDGKTVAHIEAYDEVHAINIACKMYGYKFDELYAEAQG